MLLKPLVALFLPYTLAAQLPLAQPTPHSLDRPTIIAVYAALLVIVAPLSSPRSRRCSRTIPDDHRSSSERSRLGVVSSTVQALFVRQSSRYRSKPFRINIKYPWPRRYRTPLAAGSKTHRNWRTDMSSLQLAIGSAQAVDMRRSAVPQSCTHGNRQASCIAPVYDHASWRSLRE